MAVTLVSPDQIPDTGSHFVELNRQDWRYIKTDLQAMAANIGSVYSEALNQDLSAIATISFPSAGADPSSLVAARISWTRFGGLVWGEWRAEYTVAGTTVTNIRITMPTTMPTPETLTGYTAGDIAIPFVGWMSATIGGTPVASRAWFDISALGAFRMNVVAASGSYLLFGGSFHYHTSATS